MISIPTWFAYVPVPDMISMPSLPALQMYTDYMEHRFYAMGITDTCQQRQASSINDHVLTVNVFASRRFVDCVVTGDLSVYVIHLSEHEPDLFGNHSIGRITRREHENRNHHIQYLAIIKA